MQQHAPSADAFSSDPPEGSSDASGSGSPNGSETATPGDPLGSIREARDALRSSPFLTSKQAAHFLGFSDRTLQDMRRKGTGPRYVRLGRQVRYHFEDLKAYARPAAKRP